MTWVAKLSLNWKDLAFDSSGAFALALNATSGVLHVIDIEKLTSVVPPEIESASRVLTGDDYVVLVRQAAHGAIPYTDVEVLRINFEDP